LESVPLDLIGSYLTQVDVFIGMRFHSLLLATALGTPFVAVSYDTKCARFVDENGYNYAVPLEELTEEKLTKVYETVVADKKNIPNTLAKIADKNFNEGAAWAKSFALE
jgi:polysaccharide pyruvyl transferase WcaK-like protein